MTLPLNLKRILSSTLYTVHTVRTSLPSNLASRSLADAVGISTLLLSALLPSLSGSLIVPLSQQQDEWSAEAGGCGSVLRLWWHVVCGP